MTTFQPSQYSLPARTNASSADAAAGIGGTALGLGILAGIIILPGFVITPWVVKQFKPEWSYGKRLATGMVVSFGATTLVSLARAASGSEKK